MESVIMPLCGTMPSNDRMGIRRKRIAQRLIKQRGVNAGQCSYHILFRRSALIQRKENLSAALRLAPACFDAVIILGGSFAVVYGEVMKGGGGSVC